MEFVMGLCHQVTVLDYGTVVAAGAPGIISTDPRVLDAYLGRRWTTTSRAGRAPRMADAGSGPEAGGAGA